MKILKINLLITVFALFNLTYPLIEAAEIPDERPVDICDFESLNSLITGAGEKTEGNSRRERKANARSSAYFSSMEKAEECLQTLNAGTVHQSGSGRTISGKLSADGKTFDVTINAKGEKPDEHNMSIKWDSDRKSFSILKPASFGSNFKWRDRTPNTGGNNTSKHTFVTRRFCGNKDWTHDQLIRKKAECENKKHHTWKADPECECEENFCIEGDTKISWDKANRLKKECEEKGITESRKGTTTYQWVGCHCEKTTKPKAECNDGSAEGKIIYDQEYQKCEVKYGAGKFEFTQDCQCNKLKIVKEKFCNGRYTEAQLKRKEQSCKGSNEVWYGPGASGTDVNGDPVEECSCVDQCYGEEKKEFEEEKPCYKPVPTIGSTSVIDIAQDICGTPNKDLTINEDITKQCDDALKSLNLNLSQIGTPVTKSIPITVDEQVLCEAGKERTLNADEGADEYFPYNVPTHDLSKFTKDCAGYDKPENKDCALVKEIKGCVLSGKSSTQTGDIGQFRTSSGQSSQKPISCSEWNQIKAANSSIKKQALSLVNQVFAESSILNGKTNITTADLEKLQKELEFKINILGTANRSNNGTNMTLYQLANERREESKALTQGEIQRLMTETIKQKYGINYDFKPNVTLTEGYTGGFGPLAPFNTLQSMKGVVYEGDAPKDFNLRTKYEEYLKQKLPDDQIKAKIYEDSVNHFFDVECPSMSNKPMGSELQEICGQYTKDDFFNYPEKDANGNIVKKSLFKETKDKNGKSVKTIDPDVAKLYRSTQSPFENLKRFDLTMQVTGPDLYQPPKYQKKGNIIVTCTANVDEKLQWDPNNKVQVGVIKITKPGFFRRFKVDCRNEKKRLKEKYGKDGFKQATSGGLRVEPASGEGK